MTVPSADRTPPADDFGDGLFDEPVVKPAVHAPPAPPRASAPVSPPKATPQADEDDGFGEGLL